MAGSQLEHDTAHGLQSWRWTLLAFGVMAIVLLWQEHRAHLLGILPYLFLLSCPLLHLLHHRGHRHGLPRDEEDHHA